MRDCVLEASAERKLEKSQDAPVNFESSILSKCIETNSKITDYYAEPVGCSRAVCGRFLFSILCRSHCLPSLLPPALTCPGATFRKDNVSL
jgi:hypothetical protein